MTFNKTTAKDSVINEALLPDRINETIAMNSPDKILNSLVFANEWGSPKTKKSVKRREPPKIEDNMSPEKNGVAREAEKQ